MPRSGAATVWPSRDEVLRVRASRRRRDVDGAARGAVRRRIAGRDAPGRRRSSPRSSTRRCTRRRCSTCGIGCRTSRSASPRTCRYELGRRRRRRTRRSSRFPRASRRSAPTGDRDPVRLGQRVRRAPRRRAGVRHRRAQRHQRRVPRVRGGGRLSTTASCGPTKAGSGASRSVVEHPAFWIRDDGRVALARHVRGRFRCRWPGRSTSARRKRRPSRAGRDARLPTEAEYHRAAFGTPATATSARSRGASAAPDATRGNFDFASLGAGAGRHRVPRARARGACTISSATAGSGRRRSSRRSPASSRWRRIRSTRPISSTASTT